MYKLLIVDDEKQVREGLKRLLPWQDYGITIIGEAINGREALEIIKAQRPDIVLLDIQMPVMNGLELAERIHGQYPECKFVVLSGYNDFARVREAMRYGAVDYLLKPSGKEEFIRTIEEIIDSLEDSLISRLHNSEYLALLKNNVLNRLVSGTISSRELKDRLALLQLDLSSGCFGIASVEIAKDKNMVEDDASWQIFNVCNICDEIMVQSGKGVAFTDFSGRVNMIIKDFSGWSTDTQLKNLLESCIGEIKKRLKLKVTIAVGNQVSSTRKMYVSYKNALRTLSYRFIFGIGTVLYYDEINEYFEKTPGVVSINSDRFR